MPARWRAAQASSSRHQSSGVGASAPSPPRSGGMSSSRISRPGAVTVSRRAAFTSCRTLPGQPNAARRSCALGGERLRFDAELARGERKVMRQQLRDIARPVRAGKARGSGSRSGDAAGPRGTGPASRARRDPGASPRSRARRPRSACCRRRDRTRPRRARAAGAPAAPVLMSPISSRKSVPPSACSKRPRRIASAPVKAPFSWPKSSDSSRSDAIAEVLSAMKGAFPRGLCRCSARATSSLPVPDSPVTSTDRLERDSRPIARNTSCIAGRLAENARESSGPASSARPAAPWVAARRTSATASSMSKGFGRYSNAPPR